jgi:hypothetical protein
LVDSAKERLHENVLDQFNFALPKLNTTPAVPEAEIELENCSWK